MIDFVLNIWKREKICHPFGNDKRFVVLDMVEEVEGLEEVKWGDKLRKTRIEQNDISISWELDGVKKGDRLKSQDLDEYDWKAIRGSDIKPNAFKLVKPYVMVGWKYKDIGKVLGYSERWVQDVAPVVKKAIAARRGGV